MPSKLPTVAVKPWDIPPAAPRNLDPNSAEWHAYQDTIRGQQAQGYAASVAQRQRDHKWTNLASKAALTGVGALFAGPAMGALYSGGGAVGAAGAGAATAPTATAASAGKLATLGKLFSSPGFELAVNSGLNLYGQKQSTKAADQARADQLASNREAIAIERQRLEMEARNADLDRADAKALNDAINELKRRELAASEEERVYSRGLVEARETRMAPYRDASVSALNRLQSLWGMS